MNQRLLILLSISTFFIACSNDSNEGDEVTTVNKVINRQATGSSANNLLSDDKYTSILIELVYIEGYEPSQIAIDEFVSFLNARTYKPDGIFVEKRGIPSPGKNVYTIEEVADIERENRERYNTDNQVAVWALFLDGKSENDEENRVVLGTAYWNTSFVIYEKTIQNLSDSPFKPERSLLEVTVINHEFGHILGLTDLGSLMQTDHEDKEHPNHCNVDSCLMHWEVETSSSVFNMSSSSTSPELDPQCLADLRANGGK